MLDVPEKINLSHDVKLPPVKVELSLYNKEKNTFCGIPVTVLVVAGVCLGVVLILKARRKK